MLDFGDQILAICIKILFKTQIRSCMASFETMESNQKFKNDWWTEFIQDSAEKFSDGRDKFRLICYVEAKLFLICVLLDMGIQNTQAMTFLCVGNLYTVKPEGDWPTNFNFII